MGDIGETTIKVNEEIVAKTFPCRKLPLSMQYDVKTEINQLADREFFIPVSETTEWVIQMPVVRKASGKRRIILARNQ